MVKFFYFLVFFLSANFLFSAETYVEKVLFSIPQSQYVPPTNFDVDVNDNFYLFYQDQKLIKVFNSAGKQIRTINVNLGNPSVLYQIRIADDGNLLIYPTASADFQVLDGTGKQVEHGTMNPSGEPKKIRLEGGVIFSDQDGFIYHRGKSKNSFKSKKTLAKDFKIQGGKKPHSFSVLRGPGGDQNSLPVSFGDFKFNDVWAVDDSENLYVLYATNVQETPEFYYDSTKFYPRSYRTYKFNKNLEEEAEFDFWVQSLNEQTQNLYSIAANNQGTIDFIKWQKNI